MTDEWWDAKEQCELVERQSQIIEQRGEQIIRRGFGRYLKMTVRYVQSLEEYGLRHD